MILSLDILVDYVFIKQCVDTCRLQAPLLTDQPSVKQCVILKIMFRQPSSQVLIFCELRSVCQTLLTRMPGQHFHNSRYCVGEIVTNGESL